MTADATSYYPCGAGYGLITRSSRFGALVHHQPPCCVFNPRHHREGNIVRWVPGLIATTAIALAVTACASAGSGSAAGAPSGGSPSASALAAAPSATASAAPCTSHACIVEDAKSALVGGVAKDESVMTALTCYSTSVKNPDPDIYTVSCVATYSDGSEWDGIASVLLSQSKVTWEPTQQVQ
jgi:hypothetical protein